MSDSDSKEETEAKRRKETKIESAAAAQVNLAGESNDRLLGRLDRMVRRDRSCEARLVEVLGEVDARRLYLGRACSSMFEYCVRVLHFAEGVAFKRIAVARAGRRHPELVSALASGEIHLTAACLIAPHLDGRDGNSDANCKDNGNAGANPSANGRGGGAATATTGATAAVVLMSGSRWHAMRPRARSSDGSRIESLRRM